MEIRIPKRKINYNLTEREANVLALRKVYTLQKIADMYGISKERVRQIQKKAEYKIENGKRFPLIISEDVYSLLNEEEKNMHWFYNAIFKYFIHVFSSSEDRDKFIIRLNEICKEVNGGNEGQEN